LLQAETHAELTRLYSLSNYGLSRCAPEVLCVELTLGSS
jgi:hypothetical protein